MTLLEGFLIGGLVTLGLMTLLWLVSLTLRDSSIVDPFWGTGSVIVNWLYFALTPDGLPARKWITVILVTIWGLRLSGYLLWRNWGKGEDFRYQKWRQESGKNWWWFSFFKVYLFQGVLLWIISTPLLAAQYGSTSGGLTGLDVLVIAVWLLGFFFEAAGNFQLARFKADPANKGKVLDRGVWRYTRHPNYFGEIVLWIGVAIITLPVLQGWQWVTLISPVFVTLLLTRVSGIPMLEKRADEKWGGQDDYEAYKDRTPVLIPRPQSSSGGP